MFFDDFCRSFVLALQYLDALLAAGKDILYITSKDVAIDSKLFYIVDAVKNRNVEVCIISQGEKKDRYKEIFDTIIKFRPEKILLHIYANSVSIPVIYRLPKQIQRFIINLADQTFWLGAGAVDYVLEFRQFGVSVSQQRRKINPQQQLLVPFYPVVDGNPFQGFPEGMQKDGKVVIFSGSDLYKVLDKERKFWYLIKKVMDTFPEVVFWFATKVEGQRLDIIDDFIRDNHYEGRFFYTPFRRDINEVLAHVDIFMGTCPVCGSLMSQLAARNATPILQYYYPGTPDDETEQAICVNEEFNISFDNEADFMVEAEKLVHNPEYRKKQGERLQRAMVSPEQFNTMVAKALSKNETPVPLKPFAVDYELLDNRWFELQELGHINVVPYICGVLGRGRQFLYVPALYFKRYHDNELFSSEKDIKIY